MAPPDSEELSFSMKSPFVISTDFTSIKFIQPPFPLREIFFLHELEEKSICSTYSIDIAPPSDSEVFSANTESEMVTLRPCLIEINLSSH